MNKYTQTAAALILSTPLLCKKAVTYDGNTSPAAITPSNSETISITATEGATQAVSEHTANESNPFSFGFVSSGLSNEDLNYTVAQIINSVHAQTNNLAVAVTIGASDLAGDPYYCGGTITVPDNANATSGKLTFKNFCYDFLGPITMNGSITFSKTATQLTVNYKNFTASFERESFTINSSVICGLNNNVVTTCSISSSYVGSDGLTYRIDDFTISGDPTFGFDVSATFYHPTHGSVGIATTSPIMLECTGPQPSSGAIAITGSSGTSASITFDSCTSYTYCYDLGSGPTCNTGTW
jgi:hypothetical protein